MDLKIPLNISDLKENKQLIFIVVVVLIIGFSGKKIWDKQNVQLAQSTKRIQNYQKMIFLADEIERLSRESQKFRGFGWLTKDSVEIMGKINDLVNKHRIEILTFDPAGFKNKGNYSTFSMALKLKSDYFDLSRFVSEIEELETLTKVMTLQVSPERGSGQGDGPLVKANLTIKAFILKN